MLLPLQPTNAKLRKSCHLTCTNWNKCFPLCHYFFAHCKASSPPWLPFRFPWRGCAHFVRGRQNIPSSARFAGHIVMLAPSSRKWPVRARIKSFSVGRLVWPTFIVFRCDLISFLQEVKGKKIPWPLDNDLKYLIFFCEWAANEQESEAIRLRFYA